MRRGKSCQKTWTMHRFWFPWSINLCSSNALVRYPTLVKIPHMKNSMRILLSARRPSKLKSIEPGIYRNSWAAVLARTRPRRLCSCLQSFQLCSTRRKAPALAVPNLPPAAGLAKCGRPTSKQRKSISRSRSSWQDLRLKSNSGLYTRVTANSKTRAVKKTMWKTLDLRTCRLARTWRSCLEPVTWLKTRRAPA